ncbi:unnamed protein product [Zymoseptoria tritici ST99CH_3D7]|uniref:Cytochrome b561 domain-containing protein n=3 Tax=Zymoseptoria tritici TaxID=1047171 RepID=A0A1X7RX28_ZYMT9|nr:unnamed protein product [Zymoseptoria tritici ST99CH_3D7]
MMHSVQAHEADAGLARNPQFCERDASTFPLDICFAIPHGGSSHGDVYLAFSGKFEQKRGWAAAGPGTVMSDAVMFVFYPSENMQNLTIGVRSATGHYPPELDDRLFSKLETSYNAFDASTGLYEASLICRGCATDLQRRHLSAEGEAWIWAYNYLQEIQSDDPSFGLGLHSHYDSFHFNVHSSGSDDQTGQLRVSSERESRLLEGDHEDSGWSTESPSLGILHGTLMTLAFLVAFPSGAAVMRSRAASSFSLHVCIQLGGVLLCLCGATAIVVHIGLSALTSHVSTHTALGLLLVISVCTQVATGYLHHVRYVRTHSRSTVTHVHVFAGRASIVLGFANTATGLTGTFLFKHAIAAWVAVAAVLLLWLSLFLWLQQRRSSNHAGDKKAEADYELVVQQMDDD